MTPIQNLKKKEEGENQMAIKMLDGVGSNVTKFHEIGHRSWKWVQELESVLLFTF